MVYPGEIDNQLQHFAVQGAAMGRHYEQLIPEERATIMMMKASNCTVRHMASVLLPSTSTIKRELARFTAWPNRAAAVPHMPSVRSFWTTHSTQFHISINRCCTWCLISFWKILCPSICRPTCQINGSRVVQYGLLGKQSQLCWKTNTL